MGSHSDNDSPIPNKLMRELFEMRTPKSVIAERLTNLQQRAIRMSSKGENLITAGQDGENVLGEWRLDGILIRRLPDDPDNVLRISIGAPEWAGTQAYFVFRGDPCKVGELLMRATRAFQSLAGEEGEG